MGRPLGRNVLMAYETTDHMRLRSRGVADIDSEVASALGSDSTVGPTQHCFIKARITIAQPVAGVLWQSDHVRGTPVVLVWRVRTNGKEPYTASP